MKITFHNFPREITRVHLPFPTEIIYQNERMIVIVVSVISHCFKTDLKVLREWNMCILSLNSPSTSVNSSQFSLIRSIDVLIDWIVKLTCLHRVQTLFIYCLHLHKKLYNVLCFLFLVPCSSIFTSSLAWSFNVLSAPATLVKCLQWMHEHLTFAPIPLALCEDFSLLLPEYSFFLEL
jgi:hypothetical protein